MFASWVESSRQLGVVQVDALLPQSQVTVVAEGSMDRHFIAPSASKMFNCVLVFHLKEGLLKCYWRACHYLLFLLILAPADT
jgi:hypothetical protein